jgi:hypothetical protein
VVVRCGVGGMAASWMARARARAVILREDCGWRTFKESIDDGGAAEWRRGLLDPRLGRVGGKSHCAARVRWGAWVRMARC